MLRSERQGRRQVPCLVPCRRVMPRYLNSHQVLGWVRSRSMTMN